MTPEQQALKTAKVTLTTIVDLYEAGEIGRIRVMPKILYEQIKFTLTKINEAINYDT